jgi:hypothetical protein
MTIKAAEITSHQNKSPELVMWQAVIAQAVTDARYQGIGKAHLECKDTAIAWFSSSSLDFRWVCHFAEMSADYIYKKFQIALQKGLFTITPEQGKILANKKTSSQMKHDKRKFKLKF